MRKDMPPHRQVPVFSLLMIVFFGSFLFFDVFDESYSFAMWIWISIWTFIFLWSIYLYWKVEKIKKQK
jgi:uncharacterized membrane protein YcaP (DUF421 family)